MAGGYERVAIDRGTGLDSIVSYNILAITREGGL